MVEAQTVEGFMRLYQCMHAVVIFNNDILQAVGIVMVTTTSTFPNLRRPPKLPAFIALFPLLIGVRPNPFVLLHSLPLGLVFCTQQHSYSPHASGIVHPLP